MPFQDAPAAPAAVTPDAGAKATTALATHLEINCGLVSFLVVVQLIRIFWILTRKADQQIENERMPAIKHVKGENIDDAHNNVKCEIFQDDLKAIREHAMLGINFEQNQCAVPSATTKIECS